MGKPTLPSTSPDSDAVSLRTQPGDHYRDADEPILFTAAQGHHGDDLPPVYDDAAEASASTSLTAPLLSDAALPGYSSSSDLQPFSRDDQAVYYLSAELDADPDLLEARVRSWAAVPPRPFVRVYGYHRERRSGRDGKKETKPITDFDIKVELTPYLFADATNRHAWSELRTVENGDKAKRGTIFPRRAPRAKGNIELGAVDKPNLTQWCHLYVASHSGLKSFSLRREIKGFDQARLREQLEALVRRLNYRGHLQVSFPVHDHTVQVWNECRTNQWRLTKWIYVMFCVSMLWLLSWPYLFFRTKRFETVSSEWHFSRVDSEGRKSYVSLTEDQWYNMWGRPIAKAILSKRQGVLDQQDLIAADDADPAFNTGHSTVDGALGFFRAGVNAMNEVNRHLGWGEDQF
ncbi:hypothetical protein UCDDA912_g00865 [Diaporthe ampelina]|uniref:Abc transporter n=1 Tax=Diaporthe ampelina TaxID=1214573 RepID=A0A0G2FZ53_9PEZI|nr:hypothetical protein UCDDA912_g00865 [Diaporthe ampelina]